MKNSREYEHGKKKGRRGRMRKHEESQGEKVEEKNHETFTYREMV